MEGFFWPQRAEKLQDKKKKQKKQQHVNWQMTCWCSLNEGSDCLFLELMSHVAVSLFTPFHIMLRQTSGAFFQSKVLKKNTHKQRDVIIQFHLLHSCVFSTLNKLVCCRRWKNKEKKFIIWIIFGLANMHKLSLCVFLALFFGFF